MASNLKKLYFVVLASLIGCSESAAPANIAAFTKECLDVTNVYRVRHQAPALVLNSNISAVSQEWADHLMSTNTFTHRPNLTYGENLYSSSSSSTSYTIPCKMAVDAWYSEVSKYKYGDGFSSATGHFTQLVWKNSRQLGVGFTSQGGKNYVVCNYSPPGNYANQFPQNVLPPTS